MFFFFFFVKHDTATADPFFCKESAGLYSYYLKKIYYFGKKALKESENIFVTFACNKTSEPE